MTMTMLEVIAITLCPQKHIVQMTYKQTEQTATELTSLSSFTQKTMTLNRVPWDLWLSSVAVEGDRALGAEEVEGRSHGGMGKSCGAEEGRKSC